MTKRSQQFERGAQDKFYALPSAVDPLLPHLAPAPDMSNPTLMMAGLPSTSTRRARNPLGTRRGTRGTGYPADFFWAGRFLQPEQSSSAVVSVMGHAPQEQ
jgi:hypothetical protein